jgi:hypothetical protein
MVELICSVTGLSRMAGPVIASAITAFVTIDPFGVFFVSGSRPSTVAVEPQRAGFDPTI